MKKFHLTQTDYGTDKYSMRKRACNRVIDTGEGGEYVPLVWTTTSFINPKYLFNATYIIGIFFPNFCNRIFFFFSFKKSQNVSLYGKKKSYVFQDIMNQIKHHNQI